MKLCGRNESCFEHGECWGHLEGTMCKYLGEKSNGIKSQSYCMKCGEFVQCYHNESEYTNVAKIKENIDKRSMIEKEIKEKDELIKKLDKKIIRLQRELERAKEK